MLFFFALFCCFCCFCLFFSIYFVCVFFILLRNCFAKISNGIFFYVLRSDTRAIHRKTIHLTNTLADYRINKSIFYWQWSHSLLVSYTLAKSGTILFGFSFITTSIWYPVVCLWLLKFCDLESESIPMNRIVSKHETSRNDSIKRCSIKYVACVKWESEFILWQIWHNYATL